MSHFTHIQTRFRNLFYLEKALNKLNILHEKQRKVLSNSKSYSTNLIISQSNGHNIEFIWNGTEYELVVDKSFWEQSSSFETFLDMVSQQYAGEVIIGESQQLGFQPVKYQQNSDGSNILILERWSN